jgi:hypothetical protein
MEDEMSKDRIPGDDCIGCRALAVLGKVAVAIVELEGAQEEMIRVTGTTEGPARMAKQFTGLLREIFESNGVGVEDIRPPEGLALHPTAELDDDPEGAHDFAADYVDGGER